MVMSAGVICSGDGLELAAIIEAIDCGRLPLEIKIVITDRDSQALGLARTAGLYGAFIPRSAFHANRDGFERRLVEMMTQAEAEAVILAGFEREVGPVLSAAFPDRLLGQGLSPEELTAFLEKKLRGGLFRLATE